MKISVFENKTDVRVNSLDLPFDELVEAFTTEIDEVVSKEHLQAWSPAEFVGTRRKENVVGVCAMVLDLDSVTKDRLNRALAAVADKGLRFLAHSTASDDAQNDKRCFRVIIPLSKQVSAHQWPSFREKAEGFLGVLDINDPATKDASRIYFSPAVVGGKKPHFEFSRDGGDLDVDALIQHQPVLTDKAAFQPKSKSEVDAAASVEYNSTEFKRRMKILATGANNAILKRILDGEPLAENGGRHGALTVACGKLASIDMKAPVGFLLEVMRRSLVAMGDDDGVSFLQKAETMLYDFKAKDLARLELERATKKADFVSSGTVLPELRAAKKWDSAKVYGAAWFENHGTYTDAEMELWAYEQGCSSVEELIPRMVLQKDDDLYPFFGGEYEQIPVSRGIAHQHLWRFLAPIPEKYGTVIAEIQRGKSIFENRPLKMETLLETFGTVFHNIEYSFVAKRTHFDPKNRALVIRQKEYNAVPPEYSAEVAGWLELLSGSSKKLLPYLATLHLTERPTAALCLIGEKDAGKTIIARLLAQFWGAGQLADAKLFMGTNFNSELLNNPIVLADEGLPTYPGMTQDVRSLITCGDFSINEKHKAVCRLRGFPRLIVTSNGDRIFSEKYMNAADSAAIAQRFIMLDIPRASTLYLQNIGGWDKIKEWMDNKTFMKHVTWLQQNLDYKPGLRFLVDGNAEEQQEKMLAINGRGSQVLNWVARAMQDDTNKSEERRRLFFVAGDGVYVSPNAISEKDIWTQYVEAYVLSPVHLGRAITDITNSTETRQITVQGKRIRYRKIPLRMLRIYAKEATISEDIEERIAMYTELCKDLE